MRKTRNETQMIRGTIRRQNLSLFHFVKSTYHSSASSVKRSEKQMKISVAL